MAAEGATATEHWAEKERRRWGIGIEVESLVWGFEEMKGFWRRLVAGWVAKAIFFFLNGGEGRRECLEGEKVRR